MLFTTYGPVLDIVTVRKGSKGQSMRGQAHVVFRDVQTSTQALRALQRFDLFGKEMVSGSASKKCQSIDKFRSSHTVEVNLRLSPSFAVLLSRLLPLLLPLPVALPLQPPYSMLLHQVFLPNLPRTASRTLLLLPSHMASRDRARKQTRRTRMRFRWMRTIVTPPWRKMTMTDAYQPRLVL